MDVITLHPPNRAEREMQVQAGLCRKSRVGENTVKTDAECDTHRKTPNKTMRNAEVNTFLHSAARRLGHFFAIKHRKNRCESKSKVQFRVSKVPKLEFQHMPAQESHHPARRQTQRLPTFWEVFWSLARKPEFCVVFVKKTMFLTLNSSLSCFLVRFLR